jgi:hypothetical protein
MDAAGKIPTDTVLFDLQPKSPVPSTVYVEGVAGVTVSTAPVTLMVSQVYVTAPLAVKEAAVPGQTEDP